MSRLRLWIIACLASWLTHAGAQPNNSAQRRALDSPAVLKLAGMEQVQARRVFYKKSEADSLRFDLYAPLDLRAGEHRPVVIFANWKRTSMPEWMLMTSWGKLVAASGLHAILYQSASDPTADLDELVTYVRRHGARLQIDGSRLALMTMSGNTVTALPFMTQAERDYIRCGVIYYGMIEKPLVRVDLPLLIVRAGLEGSADLKRNLDEYIAQLLARNAPLTLINYPAGRHAFDLHDDNEQSRAIMKETLVFLARYLRAEGEHR